ncbi:hypothetical protein ACFFRR_000103, partial [Megaselia abdita]
LTSSICIQKSSSIDTCQKAYKDNATVMTPWKKTLNDYCDINKEFTCNQKMIIEQFVNLKIIETLSSVENSTLLELLTLIKNKQGTSNWKPDVKKVDPRDALC